jgi:NADPH:quinone reductase
MAEEYRGLELRSEATENGELTLSLEEITVSDPAADEVIVRVEAAPINPSDLGLLLGPADVSTMQTGGSAERPTLTFAIPEGRLASVKGRLGQSMPVGNEGSGTVVAAGSEASNLVGKRVGMRGGAMYTQ